MEQHCHVSVSSYENVLINDILAQRFFVLFVQDVGGRILLDTSVGIVFILHLPTPQPTLISPTHPHPTFPSVRYFTHEETFPGTSLRFRSFIHVSIADLEEVKSLTGFRPHPAD